MLAYTSTSWYEVSGIRYHQLICSETQIRPNASVFIPKLLLLLTATTHQQLVG